MVRVDGSLFIGAVNHVAERLRNLEKRDRAPRDTCLIAHAMNFIDVAGAEFLTQEAARLRSDGRRLYLFRLKPKVMAFLERGGYLDEIGRDAVFESKSTGLASVVSRIDPSHCENCTARVFVECPGPAKTTEAACCKRRTAPAP
jgi:SulP family sulfate permease